MRRLSLLLILVLCACDEDSREPVQTTGTIVFIGDSITEAWPLERYLDGTVNAGISGNATSQMLERFERDVLAHRPALVVINGGINDIRIQATSDCGSLLAMVQMARAANVKVIVGTLLQAERLGTDSKSKQQLVRIMNDEIRTAADSYGFEVVDFYPLTRSPRGTFDWRKFPDGLHPNRRGYDAMWDVLLPALREQGLVREDSGG